MRLPRREAVRLCAAALPGALLLRPRFAFAQAAIATPQFAVSTVKPHTGDSNVSSGLDTSNGMLRAENVTLKRCIIGACGVGPHQVVGGPDWLDSQSFDIVAKPDHPIDDDAVLNLMLGLLADRFQLALHRETRTLSAYVLEVDKKGPKLSPASGGDSSTDTTTGRRGRAAIDAKNTDMDLFSQVLARKMDLPVVNETGLKGIFDFKVHWTPDTAAIREPGPDDVSIFTALQEQLGLRLRSAKAPVEVLVIDHAEQPSQN